jgi:D-arabinose 1-dehydrogenase-like Zn-dependent alcohol dehydrogenase
MKTMKAAVVHTFGQPLRIEDVPVSEVTSGQVLVKMVASGVCYTDLHAANFDMVLNAKTVRGSIVGTRKDLQEALAFAGEGKIHTTYSEEKLDNINAVFARMSKGEIEGRVVMRIADDV